MTGQPAPGPAAAPVPAPTARRIDPFDADAVVSLARNAALALTAATLDRAQAFELHDSTVRSALATFTIASGLGIGALGGRAETEQRAWLWLLFPFLTFAVAYLISRHVQNLTHVCRLIAEDIETARARVLATPAGDPEPVVELPQRVLHVRHALRALQVREGHGWHVDRPNELILVGAAGYLVFVAWYAEGSFGLGLALLLVGSVAGLVALIRDAWRPPRRSRS